MIRTIKRQDREQSQFIDNLYQEEEALRDSDTALPLDTFQHSPLTSVHSHPTPTSSPALQPKPTNHPFTEKSSLLKSPVLWFIPHITPSILPGLLALLSPITPIPPVLLSNYSPSFILFRKIFLAKSPFVISPTPSTPLCPLHLPQQSIQPSSIPFPSSPHSLSLTALSPL